MGWERVFSSLLCLVSGRSKVLWLHSCFSFLYFLLNLVFMAHHCLGFVPKRSYRVSKWKELPELFPPSQKLPRWTSPLPALRGIPVGHILHTCGGQSHLSRASLFPLAQWISTWHLAQLSWSVNHGNTSTLVGKQLLPGASYACALLPPPPSEDPWAPASQH